MRGDQAGVDVALQLCGVDRDQVEVLAFAALDLRPDLVVGADEDDVHVDAGLLLELLHPVVVGIALPRQDAEFLGNRASACSMKASAPTRQSAAFSAKFLSSHPPVQNAVSSAAAISLRAQTQPASTMKFCDVHMRLSSDASHSTMRAMSGG